MLISLAASLLLLQAAPAGGAAAQEVFTCEVSGKRLWITAQGTDLVYHYGLPGNEELTITGKPGAGNLHYRLRDETTDGDRYIAASVRFTNRGYNYIVNYDIRSRPPYPLGAHFDIVKDGRTLKVEACSSFSVNRRAYDFSQVPSEDPKFYSEVQ